MFARIQTAFKNRKHCWIISWKTMKVCATESRRQGSIAKYCTKRLSSTTEVMAIYKGKVVFSRCSKFLFEGPCLDPKPSFYTNDDLFSFKNSQSEFGESEISEDDVTIPVLRNGKASLKSISLPAEDFTKQRPGWPLLPTSSSMTQPAFEARNMSVVQWVMTLPHRHSLDVSEVKAILAKNSACCEVFDHNILKTATTGFSSGNLIGKGGCNSVYKGILPEGKAIAVKTMQSSKEAWKDFLHEIDIVTTLKHKRIAPLLGVCIADSDLISVYEFMPKGNLSENLHGKSNSALSWEARFRIAVEVAEALNYLHNECQRPIIHRDVKSSNILLTEKSEPQLCDFGLATWGPTTASFVMDSDVVGTFGYLAPEYFMYGRVSEKIDVYAFGVVLLELLSGQKPIGLETMKGQESLVMWARPVLENRDFTLLLDPNLDGNVNEAQMQRMAIAAALCITQAARLRPNICQILDVLCGEGGLNGFEMNTGSHDHSENWDDDDDDDEVYPNLSVESHLSVAFVDVKDEFNSIGDEESSRPVSVCVEEYLKKRCSRSSSIG